MPDFPTCCVFELPTHSLTTSSTLARMTNVTQLLHAIQAGQSQASADLLPLVYQELRQLAAAKLAEEKPGQTLQATALVHEAWLRLVGTDDSKAWNHRGHFFGAAAEAMRRILVDRARHKARQRYGGGRQRIDLSQVRMATEDSDDTLLAVSDALEALAKISPRKAELVKLRYFTGMTLPEIAEVLGVSQSTVERDWAYARSWLYQEIQEHQLPDDGFSSPTH